MIGKFRTGPTLVVQTLDLVRRCRIRDLVHITQSTLAHLVLLLGLILNKAADENALTDCVLILRHIVESLI